MNFGQVETIDLEKDFGTGTMAIELIIHTGTKMNQITMMAKIAWHSVVSILGHGMMNRVALVDHLFVNYTRVISPSTVKLPVVQTPMTTVVQNAGTKALQRNIPSTGQVLTKKFAKQPARGKRTGVGPELAPITWQKIVFVAMTSTSLLPILRGVSF